ncbi:copper chaperone [Bosea sp. BE125]|jgi:copper chaperone|uniref:heavy-metal-associated domain-containing protein n=1 Tax=unclassified Bosea (in: a-proteobacteria) TaxID=2653178 RepID=UPI00285D1757|nr:heavy-metal-associated domain-containing protein [Bosea sp. BE125]MDR6873921.1 copper chaperone [Bosea sp. BE125]
MCSCSQHAAPTTTETGATPDQAVILLVDDMTCGHCAGTIKGAIEQALPGSSVTADPASKRVTITGASDSAAIQAIVTKAGYTPLLAGASA